MTFAYSILLTFQTHISILVYTKEMKIILQVTNLVLNITWQYEVNSYDNEKVIEETRMHHHSVRATIY